MLLAELFAPTEKFGLLGLKFVTPLGPPLVQRRPTGFECRVLSQQGLGEFEQSLLSVVHFLDGAVKLAFLLVQFCLTLSDHQPLGL